MNKRIFLLLTVIIISIFIISCTPKQTLSNEELQYYEDGRLTCIDYIDEEKHLDYSDFKEKYKSITFESDKDYKFYGAVIQFCVSWNYINDNLGVVDKIEYYNEHTDLMNESLDIILDEFYNKYKDDIEKIKEEK